MKNIYEILEDENAVVIFLKKRNGEEFKTYIDKEDLNKVLQLNLSWHLRYANNTKSYYAKATQTYWNEDSIRKQRTIYLHMVIMNSDFSKGEQVDHLDHDTLNNRKDNLKIKDAITNGQNRHGANRNSFTGVRNVSFSSQENRFIVQFQVNGKNKRFGKFNNLEEAAVLANDLREKIYGSI